jgi:hypothetical protein
MQKLDEDDVIDLLNRMSFKAPSADALWTPNRERRTVWRSSRGAAVVVAIAATLVFAVGAAAATGGFFNQILPVGQCPAGDQFCGTDYTRVAVAVDHTTTVTMVNVLVKPGLSHQRLLQIGADVAKANPDHRVIVYMFGDVPGGTVSAGFGESPISDAAPAPTPLASLAPYWVMTYDDGPSGVIQTTP